MNSVNSGNQITNSSYSTLNSVYTRQAMYAVLNIEALSCNHCCDGKAINITYSKCVIVALFIQHAKRMHHIIL